MYKTVTFTLGWSNTLSLLKQLIFRILNKYVITYKLSIFLEEKSSIEINL